MPEIELYDIKTNHLVPLGEEELGRHKNLIDSLEQLLGGAFDPLTDLGRVEEKEMFASISQSGGAFILDSPDVLLHGDSMKLVHRDSSAGLGWRLDDELTWRVASPDTYTLYFLHTKIERPDPAARGAAPPSCAHVGRAFGFGAPRYLTGSRPGALADGYARACIHS